MNRREVLGLCTNDDLGLADHPCRSEEARHAMDGRGWDAASRHIPLGTQDRHGAGAPCMGRRVSGTGHPTGRTSRQSRPGRPRLDPDMRGFDAGRVSGAPSRARPDGAWAP